MSLKFHPRRGTILFCNYVGFRVPEMVKKRPVIVVSPRLRHAHQALCSIVPLSRTEPRPARRYHCEIELVPPLPGHWNAPRCWAKCDMIDTVGFWRLDLVAIGKDASGKRMYRMDILSDVQMQRIVECIRHALNL